MRLILANRVFIIKSLNIAKNESRQNTQEQMGRITTELKPDLE